MECILVSRMYFLGKDCKHKPKLGTSRTQIFFSDSLVGSFFILFIKIHSQLEFKSHLEIKSQLELWKPKKGANQSKIRFSILNISNQSNFEPLKIGILILICINFHQVFLLCCYQVVFRSYRQSKFTNKVTMLTPKKGANQNQNQWSQLERLFEQFRPFPNIVRRCVAPRFAHSPGQPRSMQTSSEPFSLIIEN